MIGATSIPTPTGDLDVNGWSIFWTVVTVVATYAVARLAAAGTLRLAHRMQSVPDDLALQASRVARYFVIVLGIGVALSVLGAPIQPVLVGLLVVAAGVFLMLRGIADNIGAGLVLQVRHPVRLGDLVESHGYLGYVRDLNSRSVVLQTRDGRRVHVPNHELMKAPLVNLSANGQCRSELEVRVAGSDVEALRARVLQLARHVRGVHHEPKPYALVASVEPERTTLLLRVWHAPGADARVCSRAAAAVQQGLTADGIAAAVSWPPPDQPLTRPGAV